MAVSKRLRYEILRRDGHACRYCGARAPGVALTVDHVVPVTLGGADDPTNLVAACVDCNAGKSSASPDATLIADVTEAAVRWAQLMRQAAEVQHLARHEIEEICEVVDSFWRGYTYTATGEEVARPSDWRQSIRSFYEAGMRHELDSMLLCDMIEKAMARPRLTGDGVWRYFCGCVWNVIRKRQEIAADMYEDDHG
jgi:hypothetical protein